MMCTSPAGLPAKAVPRLCVLAVLATLTPVSGQIPGVDFEPAIPEEIVGRHGAFAAVADFNADGHVDLGVSHDGDQANESVAIYLGDGLGRFMDESVTTTGRSANDFAAADFDLDGILDVAVVDVYWGFGGPCGSDDSFPVLGVGDGSFVHIPPCLPYAGGVDLEAYATAAADFNNDGKRDLVVTRAGNYGAQNLSIYIGVGTGNFQAPTTISLSWPTDVLAEDLDLDGNADLVVDTSSGLRIYYGDGNASFALGSSVANSGMVATGDIDGDGIVDLVDGQSVFIGSGDRTFLPGVPHGGTGGSVAVADLNQDGHQDVVVSNYSGNSVTVLLGDGTANFLDPLTFAVGTQPEQVVVGDWNEDGWPDLATINRNRGEDGYISLLSQIPPTGPVDAEPPTVAIASPLDGGTVANTVAVTHDVTDDFGVTRVELYVDGMFTGVSASPFLVSWDTATVADGLHTLTAHAFDAAGNMTTSDPVVVTVDSATPVITSAPVVFTINIGDPYSYQVTATGNPVPTFSLEQSPIGMTIDGAAGLLEWTPTPDQIGPHAITVRATNTNGFDEQSFVVDGVDTESPSTPTGLIVTDTTQTSISLAWDASTDNVGVAGYRLYEYIRVNRFHSYWALKQDNITTLFTTINGLEPGSQHKYAVSVFDGANNESWKSAMVAVYTNEPPWIYHNPPGEIMQATEGQLATYDVDAGGHPIPTFSMVDGPAGMTVDEITGLVQWTPTVDDIGTGTATVRATNVEGTDDLTFEYNVVPGPDNEPPTGS